MDVGLNTYIKIKSILLLAPSGYTKYKKRNEYVNKSINLYKNNATNPFDSEIIGR